jgi:hypothetical protein
MTFSQFLYDISRFLFPMRHRLMEDVDHCRATISQLTRRNHELQEALIALAKPAPPAPRPVPVPAPPVKHGWKAYQAQLTLDQQQAAERLNATTPASLAQNLVYRDTNEVQGPPAPEFTVLARYPDLANISSVFHVDGSSKVLTT